MSDYISETWPINTHTHTRLTALFTGLPRWAGTRKVKPIWILLEQKTVSGSGISWTVCKSSTRSRQITMPALHYSSVLQAGCPSCRPTKVSKHWRPINKAIIYLINLFATSAYRIITGVKRLDKEHVTAFQSQLQNFFGHLIPLEYST